MKKLFTATISFLVISLSYAIEVPIDDFPINAYSQNANDYLSTDSKDYNKALLSPEYQGYVRKML